MTDQSAVIGSLVVPTVTQPSQAGSIPVVPEPKVEAANHTSLASNSNPSQNSLGFATPLSMSSEVIKNATVPTPTPPQDTVSKTTFATQTINQVLSTQSLAPTQSNQPSPSTVPTTISTTPTKTPPPLIVNAPVDKTKVAAIAGTPSPIKQENTPSIDLSNPLEPPVTYPFVAQPLANSNTLSPATFNAAPTTKVDQTTDLATLSTHTVAPYLQIDAIPQPTNPTAPIATSPQPAATENTTAEPVNSSLQNVHRFLLFFATVILGFLGVMGIFSAIRFIMVDFPAFEQSFNENQLGQETVMHFVLKAALMLFATAISLFFTIHTHIFRRKEIRLSLLLASFFAVFLVVGLMYFAMTIQL